MHEIQRARLVRNAVSALNDRDRERFELLVAPDVEWQLVGMFLDAPEIPHGEDAVWELFAWLDERFEGVTVTSDEILPACDEVLVPVEVTGWARASGLPLRLELTVVCRLDQGRIVEVHNHRSHVEGLRSLVRGGSDDRKPSLVAA